MKLFISSIIVLSSLCTPMAGAQNKDRDYKYSVKINGGIGIGNAYSVSTSNAGVDVGKSCVNTFGADFRYRLWKHGRTSLGINAGVSYSTTDITLKADNLTFDYTAGSDADMDGDTYQRYTTINGMSQKVSLGEFVVPIYVDLNWQLSQRFSLYVEAGLGFRFSTSAKVNDVDGVCDVYGIYPKYGNLKIDDEWLNDFGDHSLAGVTVANPQQNSLTMALRGGAGFRVWVYGPLSFECGVAYNYGLLNRLKPGAFSVGSITANDAPMSYTVGGGREMKSLSSTLDKNKLANLNLNIGLIFSF